jgi:hypothetical protein
LSPQSTLRFEDQWLTSFSGLVIFQALFQRLRLKERRATAMTDVRAAAYRPGLDRGQS